MEDAVRRDARLEARDEVGGYRRIEVITGRRQRRSWSHEEKERIVAESAMPGANISAVARRHGVNRGKLRCRLTHMGAYPERTRDRAGCPRRLGRNRNRVKRNGKRCVTPFGPTRTPPRSHRGYA